MIKETIFGRSDNWVFKTGGCDILVCVCSCAHTYICMCVCTCSYEWCTYLYGCVYIYMCTHVWRSEVNIRYLPWSFSTLFFEVGSLSELGGHLFSYTGWTMSSRDHCMSNQCQSYRCHQPHTFSWILGGWSLRSSCLWSSHFMDCITSQPMNLL